MFSFEIYDYCQKLSENGLDLYHGVKSNILNRFEQVTNRIEISSSAALLIELSPMFRNDTHSGTFEQFARWLFSNIKNLSGGYSRVDMICDWYFNNSLKNLTGNGRSHGHELLFDDDTPLPSKFNDFFLKKNGKPVLSNSILDESISVNTAEEADQKLVRHMIQCVRTGVEQYVVRTASTDVIILLIAYRQLVENFNCV